jgi:hypothetical protein
MTQAFVLDTTLAPEFELVDEEREVRSSALILPPGQFVVFAKVGVSLYKDSLASLRLAATYPAFFTGWPPGGQAPLQVAEDRSNVAIVVEYVEGDAVLETVFLSLAASLPVGGAVALHGSGAGSASVSAVKTTALEVDGIQLATHHESAPVQHRGPM